MSENMQNTQMEQNEEKLNHDEAYRFLFNNVTDIAIEHIKILTRMMVLQWQCEEICIGENISVGKVDSEKIVSSLIKMVKQSLE